MKREVTLGIGGFLGHDANAALLVDGAVVAAAQEERYTRRKHDGSFPHRAIADCLAIGGLRPADVSTVVFAEKHLQSRFFDHTRRSASRLSLLLARALPSRWEADYLAPARALFPRTPIRSAWHHLSHVAGAFYTSGCASAAFLCVDGKGEDYNATIGRVDGKRLEILGELPWEEGLGLFYAVVTNFLGFTTFGSEYKVMGLAPYGEPRFAGALRSIVETDARGAVRMRAPVRFLAPELDAGVSMVERALGMTRRRSTDPLGQEHADVAASLQQVFEEEVFKQAAWVRELTGERELLFTGGCAQNCVVAGKLRAAGLFADVHNSPVAGDMGSGLGAALLHQRALGLLDGRGVDVHGYYLGSEPGEPPAAALPYEERLAGDLFAHVARELAAGKIVAWCRDRMELGARALGARSILADARVPGMQSRLNQAVKFREGFRPFAPIVLEERVGDWFDSVRPSRYMQFVANLRPERRWPAPEGLRGMRERLDAPRSEIASVVHVDYSARLQTVERHTHPGFHALLAAFEAETGVPILINTSFNVAGQPIVRTAAEAWECFLHTDVDLLVLGDRLFRNPNELTRDEKIAWARGFTAYS
jgi:carbamoyltransferase